MIYLATFVARHEVAKSSSLDEDVSVFKDHTVTTEKRQVAQACNGWFAL